MEKDVLDEIIELLDSIEKIDVEIRYLKSRVHEIFDRIERLKAKRL